MKCALSNPSSDGWRLKTIFGNLIFRVTLVSILGHGQDLGLIYYDRLLTGLAAALKSYAKD